MESAGPTETLYCCPENTQQNLKAEGLLIHNKETIPAYVPHHSTLHVLGKVAI